MRIRKANVKRLAELIQEKRKELEESQLKAVRRIITKKRLERISQEQGYVYRERLMTPLLTVLHMIGAALSRERSFQSSWHNTGQVGRSDALSKARKRLPVGLWGGLDRWIEGQIEQDYGVEARWRGHRVIGIDGTCVSMADEKALVERYGYNNTKHGLSRFPTARMVYAFTLKTRITIAHQIDGYKVSEQELFRRMYGQMNRNDLIICDRHFAGANLYAEYQTQGLEFITPAHQRLQIERLKKLKEYSKYDCVVELPLTPKHRKENPSLPAHVLVRIIKVKAKVRGKRKAFWLVSSLLDAKKYPAQEIKDLYRKRWVVETLIEEQKVWLGSDILRSKTAEGISKELYARIVAGNLIHWLVLKACDKHKLEPKRISVSAATRLISHYSIRMSDESSDRLNELYEELLDKIALSVIPSRPNRLEPRLKKRDQKHYSALRTSRLQWRRENIANA